MGSQEEEKEKFYWVCRAKSTILVQRTDRQPLAKKSGRDMKYDVDRYEKTLSMFLCYVLME